MLKKLYIDNYRSFLDTTIEFGKFNCFIGSNNAGKSNLIDALEFLDTAIFHSIDKAVKDKSMRGQIKNYRSDKEEITLVAEFDEELFGFFGHELAATKYKVTVKITINLERKEYFKNTFIDGKYRHLSIKNHFSGFSLIAYGVLDSPSLIKDYGGLTGLKNLEIHNMELQKKRMKPFSMLISQISDNSRIEFKEGQSKETNSLIGKIFDKHHIYSRVFFGNGLFDSYFFIPYLIKNQRTNDDKLTSNGASLINYLSILKNINPAALEEISASLIGEIEIANGINSKVVNNLPELDILESMPSGEERALNVMQASEGTVHFLAIMTAICASERQIVMIEEPERSLHMRTLNYIVEQCRSSKKQIFITTHSSELLRLLRPEEIVFIYRDRNGNSKSKKASEIKNLSRMMKKTGYDIVELIQTGIVGDFEDDE